MPKQYILGSMGLQLVDSAQLNTHELPSTVAGSSSRTAPSRPPLLEDDANFLNLRDIAKEVHDLGARHLANKHDAASFATNRLMQVGIKLPKRPRVGKFLSLPELLMMASP